MRIAAGLFVNTVEQVGPYAMGAARVGGMDQSVTWLGTPVGPYSPSRCISPNLLAQREVMRPVDYYLRAQAGLRPTQRLWRRVGVRRGRPLALIPLRQCRTSRLACWHK